MTRQNRVTALGEIVAEPWRGGFMGNRGILHDADQRLGRARWCHQAWVCCVLSFRGRTRKLMQPNSYTELFFWDEATALAAGHRPCGECRYHDHQRFREAWAKAGLPGERAGEFNRTLHAARVRRDRTQVRYSADPADLPNGVFVLAEDGDRTPCLLWKGELWPLEEMDGGYADAVAVPMRVVVLTPEPLVRVIAAGYEPQVRWHG